MALLRVPSLIYVTESPDGACGHLATLVSQVFRRVQVQEDLASRVLPHDLTAVELDKQAAERPAA